MIWLVCGGRDFHDWVFLKEKLDGFSKSMGKPELLVEGGARGADLLGRMWARIRGVFTIAEYADWDQYGKRAGPIRNQLMLDKYKPDIIFAFPMGGPGTRDMIDRCKEQGFDYVTMSRYGV